jgi:glycosyltransferase involved in cell wall biosynthesis
MPKKISFCIATYNMKHTLADTVSSILGQILPNYGIEIIIYDDCSTDGTEYIPWIKTTPEIKYIRGVRNVGVGEGFNRAIEAAKGDYVMLMCADDLFTSVLSVNYMMSMFDDTVGHVSRYYYQFVDGYDGPVRAWRSKNPFVLANNPSGLLFRKEALSNCKCSNKMFVETTQLVRQVIDKGWGYRILKWDAVAVRVHKSTSTQAGYWMKRRVSSPVLDQTGLGAADIATDFVSLIQIKRGFKVSAVLEEIVNFVKVRPMNLLNIKFWFWSIVSLIIPRSLAIKLPEFYRHRIGRLFTREIEPYEA